MLLLALLCLLVSWTLPVDTMEVCLGPDSCDVMKPLPLTEARDAVDDMFFGCSSAMTELVKSKYFREENKEMFARVWKNAESCAVKNVRRRETGDEALTKDHMQAICVYTWDEDDDDEDFYKMFNEAVRKNSKNFPFHALFFWLTSAVQILSRNQKCHVTYRRTNVDFTGKVDSIMRFGSFASSSYKTTLVNFGNKTCFKIRTCLGAFLKKYSVVKEEAEVLIPPYEMFRITEKHKGRDTSRLLGCQLVYTLRSVGLVSHMNCRSVNG